MENVFLGILVSSIAFSLLWESHPNRMNLTFTRLRDPYLEIGKRVKVSRNSVKQGRPRYLVV